MAGLCVKFLVDNSDGCHVFDDILINTDGCDVFDDRLMNTDGCDVFDDRLMNTDGCHVFDYLLMNTDGCHVFNDLPMNILIKDHLVDFLVTNKLINPSQHGFLKARSCLTNMYVFWKMLQIG